jgi:hypothetical protein
MMKTKADDEGVQAVRDVRTMISAEHANDATKLVDHYLAEQERYRERLLGHVGAAQPADAADDATRRR